MCEVTPCMVSVATKRGISVIYHSAALLISTIGVVYIYVPLLHLRSKESQCIYITYHTDSKC